MLVPSMNDEEITKELIKDSRKIEQSQISRLAAAYHKERKRLKIKKRDPWAKEFFVTMPKSMNKWMVVLQKHPTTSRYSTPEDVKPCFVTWYYGPRGLRVFRLANKFIEVFNGHFFGRYNERLQLNFHQPADVIKDFFLTNDWVHPERVNHDNKEYIMSVCKEGAALGKFQEVSPVKWLVHNTFITHQQMHKKQVEGKYEMFMDAFSQLTELLKEGDLRKCEEIYSQSVRAMHHLEVMN